MFLFVVCVTFLGIVTDYQTNLSKKMPGKTHRLLQRWFYVVGGEE
jgi:hypothetical protein